LGSLFSIPSHKVILAALYFVFLQCNTSGGYFLRLFRQFPLRNAIHFRQSWKIHPEQEFPSAIGRHETVEVSLAVDEFIIKNPP
jgi:hypothetical protein